MTNADTSPDARPVGVINLFTPFGRFDVTADDVVTFPSGIPGFEQTKRFVILQSAAIAPLSCLQSVDGDPVSFFVIDPRQAMAGYRNVLGQADLARLGAQPDTVLLWLSIVSFDDAERAFVNLRAPIVINPERMLGYQVMPHNSLYPLRHPLASE